MHTPHSGGLLDTWIMPDELSLFLIVFFPPASSVENAAMPCFVNVLPNPYNTGRKKFTFNFVNIEP